MNEMTTALMSDYLPNGGSDEELKMISVVNHITEEYPPVFYMTATGDFLMNQAPVLEQKLLEKKIPHKFHFYGDAQNELGHVFHCNIKIQDAMSCNKEECDYFHKFL